MKIGIDLRSLQDKYPAGIGHYTAQVCRDLLARDQVNEYFFYFNSWRPVNYPDFCSAGKVIHNHWPGKLMTLSSLVFRGPKIDRPQNLDLFWQPNFNFVSLTRSVKKVVTVHDLSWRINRNWYSQKMRYWHRLQLIGSQLKRADRIVAVSENTKQDIIYFYKVQPEKILVINSGTSFFSTGESSLTGVPQKYLLYLGTIEPRKNVSGILAALEKIYEREPQWRNVHLVLAGGPGWANGHIWRQLKNSPYRDNFHYFGYITAEQKKTLIQGSLGLIWPSFYEGWGHPPAEAILLGKPVITSFSSSLPEIVKDKAIMIDPYNLTSLTAAILELLAGQVRVASAVEIAAWQKEFSWTAVAEKYLNVFNSLN